MLKCTKRLKWSRKKRSTGPGSREKKAPFSLTGILVKDMLEKQYYRSYNAYLRDLFGCRVHKITLDAGLTCPNRNGVKGWGGCIYCDRFGSGSNRYKEIHSIRQQLLDGKQYLQRRFKAEKFIAYFQSFSNTYAPLPQLRALYREALSEEDVVGLAVGTRPDCVNPEILDLIAEFQEKKLIWIEYGLQSFLPRTLELIRRGHTIDDFLWAVEETRKRGISVCVHVILGLPGEEKQDCLYTAERLAELDIQGLKIHSLYVNRETPLEAWYREGKYRPLSREEYVEWLCEFLERCPPDWVIQRLTGDPNPKEFVAPLWALDKQGTLKMIRDRFRQTKGFQGRRWKGWA